MARRRTPAPRSSRQPRRAVSLQQVTSDGRGGTTNSTFGNLAIPLGVGRMAAPRGAGQGTPTARPGSGKPGSGREGLRPSHMPPPDKILRTAINKHRPRQRGGAAMQPGARGEAEPCPWPSSDSEEGPTLCPVPRVAQPRFLCCVSLWLVWLWPWPWVTAAQSHVLQENAPRGSTSRHRTFQMSKQQSPGVWRRTGVEPGSSNSSVIHSQKTPGSQRPLATPFPAEPLPATGGADRHRTF